MNNTFKGFINNLPMITKVRFDSLEGKAILITVAGFEDRATGFLKKSLRLNKCFKNIIAIEYLPYDANNRKKQFQEIFNKMGNTGRNIDWITYNRNEPEIFVESFRKVCKLIKPDYTVIVDISAMSKFLIVAMFQEIRTLQNSVKIIYSEAKIYHPTKRAFNEKEFTKETPAFLTTDINKIVTTSSLSSLTMQGYPILLVAFPTFNQMELMALLNEISPQKLFLINSVPHKGLNAWRSQAILKINKRVLDYIHTKKIRASTFDYKKTLLILEKIYANYNDTHRIVLAPTGSKLQAFATFLFKQFHPEIQLLYPVTKRFDKEYTEGIEKIWELYIDNFNKLMTFIDSYRKQSLVELKRLITQFGDNV